ncbi:riboflavin synthase [Thermosipho globiformans]|uniref:riboflavin synthase n=1 Tax=Thermosipho globiformans TaxID=380685 RepID=UPI000F8F4DFE|nr:riboflavin synthase [Thermosipho globiformans]
MFTGIIEYVAKDFKIVGNTLEIKLPFSCNVGDSVSVNGICLTVKEVKNDVCYFDLGYETIEKTNIKKAKYLNIERALKIGDRLNGHFVLGHIDGVVTFLGRKAMNSGILYKFSMPKENYAIKRKGSISLNGISLTIANVSLDSFEVQVIPFTNENTNLKYLKTGDIVNYEIDVFARYRG